MKNICEWDNCKETGKFRAPTERDNIKNFRWLCEEHIKLFNNNWNYFDGMSQNEIENFLKSDLTWHRPTQKFGSVDNFFNILWNNTLNDKFNIFKEESPNHRRSSDPRIGCILLLFQSIGILAPPPHLSIKTKGGGLEGGAAKTENFHALCGWLPQVSGALRSRIKSGLSWISAQALSALAPLCSLSFV